MWRERVGNLSRTGWRQREEAASAAWRGGRQPRELTGSSSPSSSAPNILNHTPRSSQLIAELETIRELPNYCQLERANQAPSPTPRPALTTKCQTSLEADTLPPSLPSSFQTQQRALMQASTGHWTGDPMEGPLAPLLMRSKLTSPRGGLGVDQEVGQIPGLAPPSSSLSPRS